MKRKRRKATRAKGATDRAREAYAAEEMRKADVRVARLITLLYQADQDRRRWERACARYQKRADAEHAFNEAVESAPLVIVNLDAAERAAEVDDEAAG